MFLSISNSRSKILKNIDRIFRKKKYFRVVSHFVITDLSFFFIDYINYQQIFHFKHGVMFNFNSNT